MASTINSDNGVVSGSSGLKSTADTSGVLALQSNGSTGVTLDTSLNVGIGTSSPNTKIEAYTSSSGAQALLTLQQADNTPGNSWGIDFRRTGSSANVVRAKIFAVREGGDATALALSYTTSGGTLTQGLYLNSDGNLGLGVTPSAWGSNYKAMQFGAQGSIHTYVGVSMSMAANAYDSGAGAWKYIANNYACRFTQDPSNGQSVWQNAPLGTAGAALTWTTSLSINNSGAIGVGSSPSYGTSGQVLTSGGSGAAPTWSTPSAGAVSFITSVTASNSATVDLENAMTGYDLYMITFNGVYSSAGTGFRLQLKINGSYQTTSNYECSYTFAGSTGFEGAASDFIALGGSITTAASRPASGVLYVQNPSSTAAYKGVYGSMFTMPNSTEVFNYGVAGYFNNSTAALTGFRFYTNSGNIVAGTFRLYGISNS